MTIFAADIHGVQLTQIAIKLGDDENLTLGTNRHHEVAMLIGRYRVGKTISVGDSDHSPARWLAVMVAVVAVTGAIARTGVAGIVHIRHRTTDACVIVVHVALSTDAIHVVVVWMILTCQRASISKIQNPITIAIATGRVSTKLVLLTISQTVHVAIGSRV